MTKRIVVGVALLAAMMFGVWSIRVTTQDEAGSAEPRVDYGATAPSDNDGGTTSPDEPAAAAVALPEVESLVRLYPSGYRTNADSVTWRITFGGPVKTVSEEDFIILGKAWHPTVTMVTVAGDAYDVTLQAAGLSDHDGTVTLVFSNGTFIRNVDGDRFDEDSFVIDNTAPTVTFHPEGGVIDDADGNLTLTFTEAVYVELASLIDLRAHTESGDPVPFTARIEDDRTVTIDPTGAVPARTWVRVGSSYYDMAGNAGLRSTATFTLAGPEPAAPTVIRAPRSPGAPEVTRQEGLAQVSWDQVTGTTGYDLRWRQDAEWTEVTDVVSPFMIGPLLDDVRVDVQVRAKNGTGVSAWSASGSAPPTESAVNPHPRVRSLVRLDPPDRRTNADSVTWRVTFREPVTNVDGRDFVMIGERWPLTVTAAGASGDAYDVTLRAAGLADYDGTATLAFSSAMYIKNQAGNRLLNVVPDGVNEASFVIDNTAPTATFHPEHGSIGDADGDLTLTFTEAVYGYPAQGRLGAAALAGLIDLRGRTPSGDPVPFTASIGDDDRTVTIAPTGALPTETWVQIGAGYSDAAGNQGRAATATFTLDTTPPTVTIDDVPDTDGGGFVATFRFSEQVTGFTASDVAVTNGAASALTEIEAGRQWRVRIIPSGDYRVSLPADRVTDRAGNGNTASASLGGSYGADVTDPQLLSIVRQAPSRSPTPADAITWRVAFSEPVEHFTADVVALLDHRSHVPISGIARSVTAADGVGSTYDVTFAGSVLAHHDGTVRLGFLTIGTADDDWRAVAVRDGSGRSLPCCGTLGADQRTFTLDNTAPRIADIVRSDPRQEYTNQDQVAWMVTFSEPIESIGRGHFTISGADAAIAVTPEGSSNRTWRVTATGGDLAGVDGAVTLALSGARRIEDLAGNALADTTPTGADEHTFVIDHVAPALKWIFLQPADGSDVDAETATWRLTFTEDMRGVDAADFAIHGATLVVAPAGSLSVYDLVASGIDLASRRPAAIRLHFRADGDITDLAGNTLRVPRPPATLPLPQAVREPPPGR